MPGAFLQRFQFIFPGAGMDGESSGLFQSRTEGPVNFAIVPNQTDGGEIGDVGIGGEDVPKVR